MPPCADTDYPCQQVQLLTSISQSSADTANQVHILHGGVEFLGVLLTIQIFITLGFGVIRSSQGRRGQ